MTRPSRGLLDVDFLAFVDRKKPEELVAIGSRPVLHLPERVLLLPVTGIGGVGSSVRREGAVCPRTERILAIGEIARVAARPARATQSRHDEEHDDENDGIENVTERALHDGLIPSGCTSRTVPRLGLTASAHFGSAKG